MSEASEQLALVNLAIREILQTGQSVSKGDRHLENARLDTLYQMRDKLMGEVAQESAGARNRIIYVTPQ